MPKYDALKSDFSAGELSPRAQGHVDSEVYQAGANRLGNTVPTRCGSAASRAGGHWLTDGMKASSGALDNTPVQHIPIHDSPFGDFAIEISQFTMRFLDKYGVKDWNQYFCGPNVLQPGATDAQLFRFDIQDGINAWGDADSRTIFLSNPSGVGLKNYTLTKGGFTSPNLIPNGLLVGYPAGTNGHWTFSGKVAGGVLTVEFRNDLGALISSTTISGATGRFSLDFNPGATDFSIILKTANNVIAAASVFDMKLQKNATRTSLDLAALGLGVALGTERIRAASFWVSADKPIKGNPATFWILFAGGPNNSWAGKALSWTAANGGSWTFGDVPCDADSLALIKGSTDIVVYQDRVCFGNNLASGRPQLIASKIGFVQAVDAILTGGALKAQSTLFVFKVVRETYTVTGAETFATIFSAGGAAIGDVYQVPYHIPSYFPLVDDNTALQHLVGANPASRLAVKLNGVPVTVAPMLANTLPLLPTVNAPNGTVLATAPDQTTPPLLTDRRPWTGLTLWLKTPQQIHAGDIIEFSTIPLAEDPLNLTLASPTGNISWLTILRGLLLGTTSNEKIFPATSSFSVDPATGQSVSSEEESALGSDQALPALPVNDKILFLQKGRQVIRQASISITTSGGLVAEDIGAVGEHLTKPRVRSFCYLKTPVPRVVFAMDDGTGAVMTLGGKSRVAWSRFTLPAVYGGIYSVAALHGVRGSELFVGTENGVTLHWETFESDILVRTVLIPQAAPAPAIKLVFDSENPLPPIMDGWQRCAINNDTGQQCVGLSASLVGQNVYALINGQLAGPYPVVANSGDDGSHAVTFPLGAYGVNWVDAAGNLRPQEAYVGLAYPEHRIVTLPLEGGNPAGTSQAYLTRFVQCYIRFVDSYRPTVGGFQVPERGAVDPTDFLAGRLTGDARATQLTFKRAAILEISQPLPLRLEVSAIFGGVQLNSP